MFNCDWAMKHSSETRKRRQRKNRQIKKTVGKKPLETTDAQYPTVAECKAELRAVLGAAVNDADAWRQVQLAVAEELLECGDWTKKGKKLANSADILTVRNQLTHSPVCFVLFCVVLFWFFFTYLYI